MLNDFIESLTLDDITNGKIILIDKPIEWTSFDVVKYIRKSIQTRLKVKRIKVGHAGTLDPLATGLLIICYGKMTKEIDSFMGLDKSYSGKMIIGSSTPSYDLETKPNIFYQTDHINKKLIYEKITIIFDSFNHLWVQ